MRSRRLVLPASAWVRVWLPCPRGLGFETQPRAAHARLHRSGALLGLSPGSLPAPGPSPLARFCPGNLRTPYGPPGASLVGRRLAPVPGTVELGEMARACPLVEAAGQATQSHAGPGLPEQTAPATRASPRPAWPGSRPLGQGSGRWRSGSDGIPDEASHARSSGILKARQ